VLYLCERISGQPLRRQPPHARGDRPLSARRALRGQARAGVIPYIYVDRQIDRSIDVRIRCVSSFPQVPKVVMYVCERGDLPRHIYMYIYIYAYVHTYI